MGCNTSVNIQTKEDKDDRVIKVNVNNKKNKKKEDNNKKKNEEDNKEDNKEENEDYLDLGSAKKDINGNTDCKTIVNNNVSDIHNMNVNKNLYNYKSTNYKYLKDEQKNLHKSNPVLNPNKKEETYNNINYIELKHPLDNSSDEIEEQNQNTNINKNENINVTTSMEERINNYKSDIKEQIEENDDNMANYRDEDNDDMVNFGQSMTNEKINETLKEQKDVNVIFEIQSSGEKHNLNVKQDIKFNDLVEMFKNKIELSPFEKPEFMLNGVYLIDYDKSIKEYNITDKSKINVFI